MRGFPGYGQSQVRLTLSVFSRLCADAAAVLGVRPGSYAQLTLYQTLSQGCGAPARRPGNASRQPLWPGLPRRPGRRIAQGSSGGNVVI